MSCVWFFLLNLPLKLSAALTTPPPPPNTYTHRPTPSVLRAAPSTSSHVGSCLPVHYSLGVTKLQSNKTKTKMNCRASAFFFKCWYKKKKKKKEHGEKREKKSIICPTWCPWIFSPTQPVRTTVRSSDISPTLLAKLCLSIEGINYMHILNPYDIIMQTKDQIRRRNFN